MANAILLWGRLGEKKRMHPPPLTQKQKCIHIGALTHTDTHRHTQTLADTYRHIQTHTYR